MIVENKPVQRVYMNNGVAISIFYLDCYKKLGIDEIELQQCSSLHFFAQNEIFLEGIVSLLVTIEEHPNKEL